MKGFSMKKGVLLFLVLSVFSVLPCFPQKLFWTVSTDSKRWQANGSLDFSTTAASGTRLDVLPDSQYQEIDGFGGCFNELGWNALQSLQKADIDTVMKSLFDTSGCDFNICRIPIGSSDYASSYYSLDDNDGDFAMDKFDISRDKQNLLLYIKAAMKYRPDLRMWGSPWTPPQWMKTNKVYNNGGNLIQTSQSAYALYLAKAAKAYQAEGINFFMLAFQNEPYAAQPFPSCQWSGVQMRDFVKFYLGPRFKKDSVNAELYTATLNNGDFNECVAPMFNDATASSFVTGACFQWAGKDAIADVARLYPEKRLMQSETECGSGENNWTYAEYTFGLFKWYFERGANSYMQWNMVLDQTGNSHWNWKQCSMISVDVIGKTVTYNPQYHLAKHFSHFVKNGARRIKTGGAFTNSVAFKNKDGSVVVVANNSQTSSQVVALWYNGKSCGITMPAKSFSTLVIQEGTPVSQGNREGVQKARKLIVAYAGHAMRVVTPSEGLDEMIVTDAKGRMVFRAVKSCVDNTIAVPMTLSQGLYFISGRNRMNEYRSKILIY
jgi:glucosylceramidase